LASQRAARARHHRGARTHPLCPSPGRVTGGFRSYDAKKSRGRWIIFHDGAHLPLLRAFALAFGAAQHMLRTRHLPYALLGRFLPRLRPLSSGLLFESSLRARFAFYRTTPGKARSILSSIREPRFSSNLPSLSPCRHDRAPNTDMRLYPVLTSSEAQESFIGSRLKE
jgi:hypothetical protein